MLKKLLLMAVLAFSPMLVSAQDLHGMDTDGDGLNDWEETYVYYTYPDNADTDFDGLDDLYEIQNGLSPHHGANWLMEQLDWDKDGLNDMMEIRLGSDLRNPDSDGDGYTDGEEIANAYSPVNPEPIQMVKSIRIDLARQRLQRYLDYYLLDEMLISGGVGNTTPVGQFWINSKHPNAWSSMAHLWMPNWMAFKGNMYGIHALPIWPSGAVEGEDHLGTPASHGCVRVGSENAVKLYEWTPIGTSVVIHR